MIIILNITASIATGLGIITIFRHGIEGSHGKSYLFLTVGISLWFGADLYLMYSYFITGIDDYLQITIADAFWLIGYLFLSLHLVSIIKSIGIKRLSKTISILSIVIVGFIIANLIDYAYSFSNDDQIKNTKFQQNSIDLIVTVLYPVLDLSLIVPSVIVLVNIYKDYQHSVPWMLLSLSLLINALADNGYTRDYIDGNASSWPWDLFYISDFIIMIGALFWYNKFHISDLINAKRVSNREQ
ncbi:MAG: hypothetical protein ACTHJ2_06155 [Candidatus Nitrosocosmicus sp.]